MYDTPYVALQALTDDRLFERVAVKVLRARFPELRITGPSGDLNRDAFSRPLFGDHDEIVLLASTQERWKGKTGKLKKDLAKYGKYPEPDRPEKALFVTNRSVGRRSFTAYEEWAWDTLRIKLEVFDLNELALDLDTDALRHVAEYDLSVRPRKPRVLQPVAVFRDSHQHLSSGADAPLVGRDREMQLLHDALGQAQQPGAARIIVIEGPAGVGKTRLAVDAAHATATTLIAAPGTAVSAESLVDVPLDATSIVVTDDADLSHDLSGIAAMLGDPRFASVTVILTVTAGSSTDVLARWGLDQRKSRTVQLAGLDREQIDQIVIGWGFRDVAFRSHVVEGAHGSPWLAHEACQIAAEQGVFSWSDTAELLRQLAGHRLRRAGFDTAEHRAAAAALALLTTADDGRHLAVLADAVTALPQDPGRLDVLLDDLVQAGIAVGPPYRIRPAAAAPVLIAAALDSHARAKIKLRAVLKRLGHAALGMQPGDPPAPDDYSVLGVRSPRTSGNPNVEINAARLAAQLTVLAQAARLGEDQGTLEMLQQAVRELVPDQADTVAWLEVLTVAEPVAAVAPRLAGDLRDTLISHWPPAPAPSPWPGDPVRRYKCDIDALMSQALSVAEQAGRLDVNRAVSWMLECAWLSQPLLGTMGTDFAGRAVQTLLRTRLRSAAQTWDDIFAARQQVMGAVLRWGRDRCAGPPARLPEAERNVRDPAVAVHVLLAALTPLLTVIIEEHGLGMPETGKVFLWSHHALPDDPRAAGLMTTAADAVSGLLGELDLQSPAANPALRIIVRLPQHIRAESARGLGYEIPLPDYAAKIMNKAASRISEAIAASWPSLPLGIRYAAAQTTVRHGGRRGGPLADLAADGDPIAIAAAADSALGQLLTIAPVDQPHARRADAAAADEARNRRRARELAEQLPSSKAMDLLAVADAAAASTWQYDCLTTFAHTVGRTASDPQPILRRLSKGPVTAGTQLFSGLLQTWPAESSAWLKENISNKHAARIALWTADELPPDDEAALLDAIVTQLATADSAQHATETGASHSGQEDAPSPDAGDISTPDMPALATDIARHLSWCRALPAERLARLNALASSIPSRQALVQVLTAAGRILATLPEMDALAGEDNRALRLDLAGLLTQALTTADNAFAADLDPDTAAAAAAIGRVAPTETARLLADRTLSATQPVIPFRWQDLLAETPPAQREPLAVAYYERIQLHLSSRTLSAEVETAALDTLALLGHGTPHWTRLAHSWSAGKDADRARAAIALRRYWYDPLWRELVPELLDAGLSEESVTALHEGMLPADGTWSASGLGTRLEAVNPLLNDTRPVVRQFAHEAAQRVRAWMPYPPPETRLADPFPLDTPRL